MATYKAEFLAHHYAGRVRPASHYSMGWLPLLARLITAVPGLATVTNLAARTPGISSVAKRAGGIDPRRTLPRFAGQTFTSRYRGTTLARSASSPGRRVILWPDTFSNYFHPEVAQAAVTVLERAGFQVEVPGKPLCCGLTWISTGQLGTAGRMLRRTIRTLRPELRAGVPVVVLEPSCAAVFRSDAAELLGSDDARLLADRTRTLAELLTEAGWRPGGLLESLRRDDPGGDRGRRAIAQVHCHQHAIMGFDPDTEILRRCGVDVEVLDTGCCGLAGNFGFERGHYDVSTACAERGLWPAARSADPDTVVLADGFSCRTQLAAGRTGREGVHLAQLLAELTGGDVAP
jgi:Fe-S oxidoreductase